MQPLCSPPYLWRYVWVVGRKVDVKDEGSIGVWSVRGRKHQSPEGREGNQEGLRRGRSCWTLRRGAYGVSGAGSTKALVRGEASMPGEGRSSGAMGTTEE